MKFTQPKFFLFLAGLLLLLNLVQAYFTDLIFDESYYWYYSRDLAWGYFDHPPMVALMIKTGGIFFSGELGVRLVSCLMSVVMVFLLWDMIEHLKKREFVREFFILIFSVTLLNAYGFFTLPDTPLLFFLTLFLWLYKRFLNKPSYVLALLLGICMAMLMYSKYHALLVILFVFLSNLKLARNRYAWIAVVIALISYIPHLLWLYNNEFVSLKYHVYERPNRAYEFGDFTLGFLVNLIVLFGFTFPWFYLALYRSRSKDLFDRALIFLSYGFILFFFISSFNRRIQTQWLIAICIPMLIITANAMMENEKLRRWLIRAGLVNCALLLYLRLGLVYAPLFPIHYESHGNREWVEKLNQRIGHMPVVFENSYRLASMYQFYSGSEAYSLNSISYRHNQYSIDRSEAKVQHKDVLFVSSLLESGDLIIQTSPDFFMYGRFIPAFESFGKLRCYAEQNGGNDPWSERNFQLFNPYARDIDLAKLKFGLAYLDEYRQVKYETPISVRPVEDQAKVIRAGDSLSFVFRLPKTDSVVPVYFRLAVAEKRLPLGLGGNNVKIDN